MDQEACLGLEDVEMEEEEGEGSMAMSAAAYFRQMKAERRATANVVRIKDQQKRSASPEAKKKKKQWLESVGYQKEDGIETPSTMIPSEEWRLEKCRQFGEFRTKTAQKIEKTPPMKIPELKSNDEDQWHEILLEKCLEQFQNVLENFPNHTGTPPAWQMVFAIPKKHLSQLIEYLIEWSSEEGLTRPIREWIFALLLVIDLPLVQDVVSALRTLLKNCRKLRSQLSPDRQSEADEYSLFIAIIGNFFGQKDLADS
uniref:Gem-associated protein 2 n=1 Tax=Caenorhabditis tropicalis TaxID=1561998 RepID=A0A1I7UWZ6_9PELO